MSDVDVIDGKGTMISTSDAASMLRKKIAPNTKPYTESVIKCNNKLVDQWKSEVLDKIATHGCVDASIVVDSWIHFYEGMSLTQLNQLITQGHLAVPKLEQVEYWRALFQKSTVEQLHALGSGTIAMGWLTCENYGKYWYAQEKWKRIYSQSESPLIWEKERTKHRSLIRGEEFSLWDKETEEDVRQKVSTILRTPVAPEGLPGRS